MLRFLVRVGSALFCLAFFIWVNHYLLEYSFEDAVEIAWKAVVLGLVILWLFDLDDPQPKQS